MFTQIMQSKVFIVCANLLFGSSSLLGIAATILIIIGIINGVVGALSLVAVIFIVVGGVNYMTSQGDPGKTKKAKDTILYAVIGLIIAVLAFAIVNFVIVNIINHTEDNNSNNNSSSTIEGGGPI